MAEIVKGPAEDPVCQQTIKYIKYTICDLSVQGPAIKGNLIALALTYSEKSLLPLYL